jgi:mono/diheme cytochrome c family protein
VTLNRINIALLILILATAAATVATRSNLSQPNLEFLPDMKRSPAYSAFAKNNNFPNGRTLQAPVPGTVFRGLQPLDFTATKEDAIRAGEELVNPVSLAALQQQVDDSLAEELAVLATESNDETDQQDEPQTALPPSDTPPADTPPAGPALAALAPPATASMLWDASVQRGAETFVIYCVCCHGPRGAGDGPVAKRGFPPPPPLPTGKSVQMKDGQLFHVMTYGQGSMSSMAVQVSRDQRWDLVNFIRNLQANAPPPVETTDESQSPAVDAEQDPEPAAVESSEDIRP